MDVIGKDERIAAMLSNVTFMETRRCLSTFHYDSVNVIDDRRLLFVDNNEAWINEIDSRCSRLDRYDTLVLDLTTSQVCRLDRVYGADRTAFGWQRGMSCVLGNFHKLSDPDRMRLREIRRGR